MCVYGFKKKFALQVCAETTRKRARVLLLLLLLLTTLCALVERRASNGAHMYTEMSKLTAGQVYNDKLDRERACVRVRCREERAHARVQQSGAPGASGAIQVAQLTTSSNDSNLQTTHKLAGWLARSVSCRTLVADCRCRIIALEQCVLARNASARAKSGGLHLRQMEANRAMDARDLQQPSNELRAASRRSCDAQPRATTRGH